MNYLAIHRFDGCGGSRFSARRLAKYCPRALASVFSNGCCCRTPNRSFTVIPSLSIVSRQTRQRACASQAVTSNSTLPASSIRNSFTLHRAVVARLGGASCTAAVAFDFVFAALHQPSGNCQVHSCRLGLFDPENTPEGTFPCRRKTPRMKATPRRP